jgi:hypothetical protein
MSLSGVIGKLSRAVLRGLGGSNALPATRPFRKTMLNVETCTRQLQSQPVFNSIATILPLTLAIHPPTIAVVLAASCFSSSSPAQRPALHVRETCALLKRIAK